MSKKELGITPRLRWITTGVASASLLASVFFAAKGGVFAQDWGQAVPIYIIGTIVLMDEDVRQEIMKCVDDPKQERKLRRRKKWASFWVYPLDSQWSWGKSLNLKG